MSTKNICCPKCENPYPHSHINGKLTCEECGHEWTLQVKNQRDANVKYEDLKCEFCDGDGEREVNIDGMDCPTICSFCNGTGIDQGQLEKTKPSTSFILRQLAKHLEDNPTIAEGLRNDFTKLK